MISYVHMDHLTVLSPEAVALHIIHWSVQVSVTIISALCRGRIGSCERTDIIYDIIAYIIYK